MLNHRLKNLTVKHQDYVVVGSGARKGWNGRLARSGRRPADRKGEASVNQTNALRSGARPAIPSGGSPDGTGQWPVPPTATHFRQRLNPNKSQFVDELACRLKFELSAYIISTARRQIMPLYIAVPSL